MKLNSASLFALQTTLSRYHQPALVGGGCLLFRLHLTKLQGSVYPDEYAKHTQSISSDEMFFKTKRRKTVFGFVEEISRSGKKDGS